MIHPPNTNRFDLRQRRFGRINWLGLWTLIEREVRRFITVYSQTLLAPIITAALFLTVFSLALGHNRSDINGISFEQFIAPGVIMMTVIQNAFANTSSSWVISKVQGNIVDSLTPPLSAHELVIGFCMGGVVRGVLIAILAALVLFPFVNTGLAQPHWALLFALIGALQMSLIGFAAGVWAEKFDHMAAVTNFIITPLSFLSGSFYSAARLPDPWSLLVWGNPFFYLIDGFRYGVLGVSDADPWFGAAVSLGVCLLCYILCWRMVVTGYKLRS